MKQIEKFISPFIQSQFPAFYNDEGPQFMAFVKAYYEWMDEETQVFEVDNTAGFAVGDSVYQIHTETNSVTGEILSIEGNRIHVIHTTTEAHGEDFSAPGILYNAAINDEGGHNTTNIVREVWSGGVLHHARHLTNYRDIDTTLDAFILQFKEKYLKNIQFDTATNKKLLVKNSLDLYRSKGTERSIDLFFKLVYGTEATVSYPGDNILRPSDGRWERPEYIEISHKRTNVNYVGKQIIGALSGAKAFVERCIRRRTSAGYVDILYVSDRQGDFRNGEVLGINVNNVPTFTRNENASVLGSLKRVTIIAKGRDFKVGDIVSFSGSEAGGKGGLARVSAVNNATGLVDFLFYDGGWGYTLNADSLVSEKVLSLSNVITVSDTTVPFTLFEKAYQPLVDITFASNTGPLAVGNKIYRYNGSTLVSTAAIVDIEDNLITVNHLSGPISTGTYYTTANAVSFTASSFDDRTIGSDVMGIPDAYTLSITDQTGIFALGDVVVQTSADKEFARGTISEIIAGVGLTTLKLTNASGTFYVGEAVHKLSDASVTASVYQVDMTVGVYNIERQVNTLTYNSANNNTILNSTHLYTYATDGSILSKGKIITATYSAGTGTITYLPISGYFDDTNKIFTDANTAQAYVSVSSTSVSGGDYIPTDYSTLIVPYSNTSAQLITQSSGSGAGFAVGTIGETEDIFIGTDQISANSTVYADYDRIVITVASSTGFEVGDRVYQQVSSIAFNPSTAINPTNGFIQIPSANTRYMPGDIIRYEVATGNTDINCLVDGNYYYVYQSNSSGITLSYPYRKTDAINTANFPGFADNLVNETGHFFYKEAHGTVFEVATGVIKTKDNHSYFGNTGGPFDTTAFSNNDIFNYATADHTAIQDIASYTTTVRPSRKYYTQPITAAAYGFFKNPQGDAKDKIFSCLNFEKFTLGTIGSLASVNPGANYNTDPYVLAYQPYIAGFSRKDFVLDIKNADGIFITGERVTQTLANLVYHDIEVSNGAYGNTYNQKTLTFSTKNEVSSTNEFIYYASNSSSFNSSDVNATLNFIPITNADTIYDVNDTVRYYTDTGNTAIAGLSNNAFYTVSAANSSGIIISGDITFTPNTSVFNSNSEGVSTALSFIYITNADTYYSNGDEVRYYVDTDTIPLPGLTNNSIYFVVGANSSGLKLSETSGGSAIAIESQTPGSTNHHIKWYDSGQTGNHIVRYYNEFVDGQNVLYRVVGSGSIGLDDMGLYTITSANSIGFKLANSAGTADLTAAGTQEFHTISTIPGFLPGDKIYQGSSNAFVYGVFSNTSGDWLRIQGNTGSFAVTSATNQILYSYTNPYVSANVLTIDSDIQVVATSKGIVKTANSSQVTVKRLTFENNFEVDSILKGELTGFEAIVTGVAEQNNVLQIGLNADIQANVVTANGQVASLEIIDSGIKYANSETITFTSVDGLRSGSAKVEIDGSGIGKGYWKSSKGFLSADMFVHDGDYYQEYSYEIFSKMSVDKYADMFKKVMHTAGTKFFGSAVIADEANVISNISSIATSQEISFDGLNDVSSGNETINVQVSPNPFANGDIVKYYTLDTVISGLSNNTNYYIVQTNDTYIKLAETVGGTPINITAGSGDHYLLKVVEE